MTRSFKNEKNKLLFSIKADPRKLIFVIANLALYAVFICTDRIDDYVFALIVVILCLTFLVSELFCNKRISRCFYLFPYCKRNCIYQYRTKKSGRRESETCQDILNYEIENLIEKLPEGLFSSLTHEFLILQLLKNGNTKILLCEEAYEKDILSLQNNMYGCKKCPNDKKESCRIRNKGKKSRQFYYIEFEKREEQSNPTR